MGFIRVLTDEDVAAFHHLRRRALQEEPEAFAMMPEEMRSVETLAAWFRDEADGQNAFIMGAFDVELAGIVGCVRERHMKRRHAAVLWGVYVTPEHRGRGLGRRLFLDTIVRARQWPDLEQLWLDVTITNLPARTLHLSCGFQIIGVRPRALKAGDRYLDEEMMALDLRSLR
jgi:RimJ/RimL family protein N-acetyltransferase